MLFSLGSRPTTSPELTAAAPRAWNAEQPNLYLLTARLKSGDTVAHELVEKIGFRQTEIRDTAI
ncbi:MAG: hypothetical protein HQ498_04170, partial [Pseudohongiella sp.]|nr:hypothetical protein [Pseudohongiella sp.]